jgi:hypothetical protein
MSDVMGLAQVMTVICKGVAFRLTLKMKTKRVYIASCGLEKMELSK